MNLPWALLLFLVFPGFLFAALAGMVLSWVDRKVTARVQWRKGPPLLQPLYDLFKLFGKETLVPSGGSRSAFLLAPVAGLAGATLAAAYIGTAAFLPSFAARIAFGGDLIVVLYLLVVPSLALILGGAASKNPLASVGASREMKLVLAYELPFILVMLVPVIQSGGELQLTNLLAWQAAHGSVAWSLSGVIALLVVIPVVQAKLGMVPFDQAEAETEIMGGVLIEYSGPPLALFKLTKMMMLYTAPLFVVVVLWGGFSTAAGSSSAVGADALRFTAGSIGLGIVKFLVLIVAAVVIRNTNPRLRIQHAVSFFWRPVSLAAMVSVAVALLGV